MYYESSTSRGLLSIVIRYILTSWGRKVVTLNGTRIAERRLLLGYSQEELAALIGTSQKMISRYETGMEPGASKVRALAQALNTSTDYLLGLTDNPDRPLRNSGDLSTDEIEIVRVLRSNHEYLKIVKSLLRSLVTTGVG